MGYERQHTDGVTLEECEVLVDGVNLMTAENLDWKVAQDKKMLYGPGGKGKAHGRVRGPKKYELNFDCKALNQAILIRPEDFDGLPTGDVTKFTLNGTEYEDLMDLRNVTIVFIYPEQDGRRIKRTFKGFEFHEDSGSMSIDDAEGRKLSGAAISAEGLI